MKFLTETETFAFVLKNINQIGYRKKMLFILINY